MPTDAKLVQAARSSDEKAFETLVEKYRPRIYAAISGFIKNTQDRENIAQETFINAYRNLHQLSKPDRFSYWLITIAQNQCRDWKRKNRVHTIPIDEVDENLLNSDDSPERKSSQAEQRQIIAQAIQSLPETERQIAQAHYLEGASHHELVDRHGISYQAVCVRLSRAKRKLAKRLGHLLTGVFVTPATTLKQIYSGGLTLMKIGTTPKITIGAIGIIALLCIGFGVHQIILPKFGVSKDGSSSVQTEAPSKELVETDTNQETENRESQPQISDKEMEQINNFFAQFDVADAQSEAGTGRSSTDASANQNADESDAINALATPADTTQSAEDVMNAYLEAFKNVDFEAMGPLMIGTAKEQLQFEENALRNTNFMEFTFEETEGVLTEEMAEINEKIKAEYKQQFEQQMFESLLKMYSQVEVASPEYVGDEFHFRLRMSLQYLHEGMLEGLAWRGELKEVPPEPSGPKNIELIVKMRKENGAWRIYER